jgi:acyl-coenzyme A synthetase/AMP-(fatty) acid ligase
VDVGAAIIFGNRLRASATASVAREYACTFAYASPWHVRRLADLDAGSLPSCLTRIISTTTALDSDVSQRLSERHGIPVFQAFGIIECGLPLLSDGVPGEAVGRFRVIPGFDIAIRDADVDGVGELCLAGPGFLDAYLSPWRPQAQILEEGRWFRSGDLARKEGQHHVQLLGRLKDLINVGGVKVFPLEVEAVLDAHPDVLASKVRAEGDPRTGEHVIAEVQLKLGADAKSVRESLATWCGERLAALKCPARIEICAALELTPSGKVRR